MGAFSQRSFGPNSTWDSIETTNIGKTHPTLFGGSKFRPFDFSALGLYFPEQPKSTTHVKRFFYGKMCKIFFLQILPGNRYKTKQYYWYNHKNTCACTRYTTNMHSINENGTWHKALQYSLYNIKYRSISKINMYLYKAYLSNNL